MKTYMFSELLHKENGFLSNLTNHCLFSVSSIQLEVHLCTIKSAIKSATWYRNTKLICLIRSSLAHFACAAPQSTTATADFSSKKARQILSWLIGRKHERRWSYLDIWPFSHCLKQVWTRVNVKKPKLMFQGVFTMSEARLKYREEKRLARKAAREQTKQRRIGKQW